uniref:Uncharacterized protein n=1 Tax=Arundo donax TaxID=35708 RepID=A0A0A9HAV4_ARUDO
MRVNTTILGCQLSLHKHRELFDHHILILKCQQSSPCWGTTTPILLTRIADRQRSCLAAV